MSQFPAVYNFSSLLNQGVILIDAALIQQQVEAEYRAVFGNDLSVEANTPQGILIQAEIQSRIAVANNNAALANQINPNIAGGVFLDAIVALTNPYGRFPAASSIVLATVTGTPGTIIPAGSIAAETASGDENQFATTIDVTIGVSGSTDTVQFDSVVQGAIPCAPGALTKIITPVLGWETVTNPLKALQGNLAVPDYLTRTFRNDTLAAQGASTAQSIISAIILSGRAVSVFFQENIAATTEVINGITMVSHSIYACVFNADLGTPSQVLATVTGTPATVIPAGSQASSNGVVFETLTNTTIPGGGSISGVIFQSLSTGAIPVPIGTLNTIVTPVSGWTTVTNPASTSSFGLPSRTAQAMVAKKSAGAAYNNGLGVPISAVIVVPFSGQVMTVLFDTPNVIQINVVVFIKLLGAVNNPTQVVTDALVAYSNRALSGFAGLVVGQNVSSFELASVIASQNTLIYVQGLNIAKNPTAPTTPAEIAIAVYEIAQIEAGNIVVNIV